MMEDQAKGGRQQMSTQQVLMLIKHQGRGNDVGPNGASHAATPTNASNQRSQTQIQSQPSAQQKPSLADLQRLVKSTSKAEVLKHHHAGSKSTMSKKEISVKQVDLQAKFASLLKQTTPQAWTDNSKIPFSLNQAHKAKLLQTAKDSGKVQNIGQASSVPNSGKQARKEVNAATAARGQLFGDGKKDPTQKQQRDHSGQKTVSPPRHQSNSRQTPVQQQMLIIQNPPVARHSGGPVGLIAQKTSHSPLRGTQARTAGSLNRNQSHTMVEVDLQARSSHEGNARSSAQTSQATSGNYRKKKQKTLMPNSSSMVHRASDTAFATLPASAHGAEQLPSQQKTAHPRSATGASKQKKKKQQPSQAAVDPVEEYLAHAQRLQMQFQTLHGLPANANNTPAVSSGEENQLTLTALDQIQNSQLRQALASVSHGVSQGESALEGIQSKLLAEFRQKCQAEMQLQTKQAMAKLLYTKREIMMEIKGVHAKQGKVEANFVTEAVVKELLASEGAALKEQAMARDAEIVATTEGRIDDVLHQIQQIVSNLEDTFFEKISQLDQQLDLGQQAQAELQDEQENDRKLTGEGLDQLSQNLIQLQDQLQQVDQRLVHQEERQIVAADDLQAESDKLKAHLEEVISMLPMNFDRKEGDQTAREEELRSQVEALIQELQAQLADDQVAVRQDLAKEIERRHEVFKQEADGLIAGSLEALSHDFMAQARDEMQLLVRKEFVAKEASLDSRMERSKQQFLKAINSNMRVLDNLISDYTTRTHKLIRQQLRSGEGMPSSRLQTSTRNPVLSSNRDVETEEVQSIQSLSMRSHPMQSRSNQTQRLVTSSALNDGQMTGQSIQQVNSLSSVQDVSAEVSKPSHAAEDELSSQLLSTAREQELKGGKGLISTATLALKIKEANNSELARHTMVRPDSKNSTSRVATLNLKQVAHSLNAASYSDRAAPYLYDKIGESQPPSSRDQDQNKISTPQKQFLDHQLVWHQDQVAHVPEDRRQFTASQEQSPQMMVAEHPSEAAVEVANPSQPCEYEMEVYAQGDDESDGGHVNDMMIDNVPSMGSEPASKGVVDSFHSPPLEDDEESKNVPTPDEDIQEQSYDFNERVQGAQADEQMLMMNMEQMSPTFQLNTGGKEHLNRNQKSHLIMVNAAEYSRTNQEIVRQQMEGNENGRSGSPFHGRSDGVPAGQSHDSASYGGLDGGEYGRISMGSKKHQPRRATQPHAPAKTVSNIYPGSSTQKQEQTDSDFFNLTAEDESQIDPIMVMRNLSNNLGSQTTNSIIQIQESLEHQRSLCGLQKRDSDEQKMDFGEQTTKHLTFGPQQCPTERPSPGNQLMILTDKSIEEGEGTQAFNPLDQQKSFENSEDD